MALKISMLLLALLSCAPGIGYGIYLWKNKKRTASLGSVLPGLAATVLAVVLLYVTAT